MNHISGTLAAGALVALTACGGSSGGSDDTLFFGAASPMASGNGLPFADGTAATTLAATSGQSVKVKMVRAVTDVATGGVRLVISDETAVFGDTDGGANANVTVTIGDETIAFTDTLGTDSKGREWFSNCFWCSTAYSEQGYLTTTTARDGNDDLNAYGFYVFGYETDPAEIVARLDQATYSGDFWTRGNTVAGDGSVTEYARFSGDVILRADFAESTIGGDLVISSGIVGFGPGTGTIAEVPITGNGFESTMSVSACSAGYTCSFDGRIAGTFFGSDAAEMSGIMAVDARSTNDESGATARHLSGGAWYATPVPD